MNYFIMQAQYKPEYSVIDGSLEQFPKSHYPTLGKKMGDIYPSNITFEMSSDFPGMTIPDFIRNALGYPIVSGKMKTSLEKNVKSEIEFLQFTLLNHKKRKLNDEFYIANVLKTIDCVDSEKTVGERSTFKPERYAYVENLFIDENKLEPELNLFRITSFPKVLIIRNDLKEILEKENLTGMEFFEMGSTVKMEG